MALGIQTVIYPVHDLARARAIFTALLGSGPAVDEPYYVGFRAGDQDIGLDPSGHQSGMSGPVPYCHVDDIRGTIARLVEAGATARQDPRDVGGGRLIATVTDPDGNVIGLLQDG